MRDHRGVFPVDLMCRSRVGSSGFYAWLKHPEIPLHRDNLILLTEIKAIYRRNGRNYGSPRIYSKLNETSHNFKGSLFDVPTWNRLKTQKEVSGNDKLCSFLPDS